MKVNELQIAAGLEGGVKKLKSLGVSAYTNNMKTASSSADNIRISGKAKDVKIAADALASADDIRSSKVEDLKARIKAGMYDVSGDAIAYSMIRSAFTEGHF